MKQILVASYIGRIIDLGNNSITVRFPTYYEKNVDFKNVTNYKEIKITSPNIDDYVIYEYEVELKEKLFISEYFRANPRKFIDNIYAKLILAPDQEEAQNFYKSISKQEEGIEYKPQFKIITVDKK